MTYRWFEAYSTVKPEPVYEKRRRMKLSDRMKDASKDIWEKYTEHPFVVEMAKGTLPREKYNYYMLQDYAYLFEYVKVLARAVINAESFEEAEYLAKHMKQTSEETLRVHVPLLKELGITDREIQEMEICGAVSDYTSYMFEVAANGKFLDCLCALASCALGYAYTAKEILKKYPSASDSSNPYSSWFIAYSGEAYEIAHRLLMEKIDTCAEKLSEDEIQKNCRTFRTCSSYELSLWDAFYSP